MNFEERQRLRDTYARISASLSHAGKPVTLIAVSKGQPVERISALYELGHRDFGENYVQELIAKEASLRPACPELRWHFLGHLQTNKIKSVAPYLSCVHSIETVKQIECIEKVWKALPACRKLSVFVAVKLSDEVSKHGVAPENLELLLERIAQSDFLQAEGLMVIPKIGESARSFEALSKLANRYRHLLSGQLSMGMSEDYLQALPFGATHVRIGTALFGPRGNTS